MDLDTIFDVLAETGLSLARLVTTLLTSMLLWFVVALAASLTLFFVLRRVGWLDAGPQRTRWSRVLCGLLLFLLFGPTATATGVVFSMRQKVASIVLAQSDRLRVTDAVGQLALLPVVTAHALLALEDKSGLASKALDVVGKEGGVRKLLHKKGRREMARRLKERAKAGLARQLSQDADVSFLLVQERNRDALALLGHAMARKALASGQSEARSSILGRLVTRLVLRYAGGSMEQRLAFYGPLLDELAAGANGKLTWRESGHQTGQALLKRTLIKRIKSPFSGLMLKLAIVGCGPLLLTLIVLRIVAFSRRRRAGRPAG